MEALILTILGWVSFLILIYMAVLNLFQTVILIFAARNIPIYNKYYFLQKGITPPEDFKVSFSILVPAYNEEKTIIEAMHSFLKLDYSNYEVILANDGSTDKTLELLIEHFELEEVNIVPADIYPCKPIKKVYYSRNEPRLVVVDKDNGGKADTQNAAANMARYKYLCVLDADTLLEEDSLNKMNYKFTLDPTVMALGGTVRIINGCTVEDGEVTHVSLPKRFCERIQVLEYLRAFLFGRIGLSATNILMIISGAFGAFHRDAFAAINGWNREAIGEDMDAVVRLHRHIYEWKTNWKISFIPDPVAWTQAPTKFKTLGVQRDRWQRGLMQVLFGNMDMCMNPKYGRVGMVGFPYFLIFELLSAVIEFICYPLTLICLIIGAVNMTFVLYFLILTIIWGVCISLMAVLLHEKTYLRYNDTRDFWGLFYLCLLENFGYRQIHSYWRLRGFLKYVFKPSERSSGMVGWQSIERESF